jgi:hypothetical protein
MIVPLFLNIVRSLGPFGTKQLYFPGGFHVVAHPPGIVISGMNKSTRPFGRPGRFLRSHDKMQDQIRVP